jgi:vanillate O-demethylase oxygenase-like protein
VTALFATTYRDGDVASGVQPQHHTVRKTARPAFNVVLRLDFPATGVAMGILFACAPETATSTRVYKLIARNDLAGDPTRIAEFVARQDVITREDLAILERYPHQALPLDPKIEAHSRVDRLSVAWRRLMADHATTAPDAAAVPNP